MPWLEDDSYPSGWRWERDVEPRTEWLPIVPPRPSPRLRPVPAPAASEPPRSELDTAEHPAPEPWPPIAAPPVTSAPYENVREADPTQRTPVKLSREPALLYIGLLAPVVQAVAAFVLNASPTLQGAVNAVAVALAGAITAALVRSDNLVPAITGAFQAVLALVLALGWDLTSEQQATVMVAVGAIAAVIVRDRVVAPVPAAAASTGVAA